MILGSMVFTVSTAEAKTSGLNAAVAAEINVAPQWGMRRGQRTVRTYVRTVRSGRRIFRETYRVVTNRNGRTRTMLVSRVRIR